MECLEDGFQKSKKCDGYTWGRFETDEGRMMVKIPGKVDMEALESECMERVHRIVSDREAREKKDREDAEKTEE